MSMISGFFRRQLFARIAGTFLSVNVVLLLALALLFSRIYLDAARDNLAVVYERSMEAKLADLESVDRYVSDLYRAIVTDPDVSVFLFSRTWDAFDEYRATTSLRRLKGLSPGVFDLTLCNAETQWCISTDYTSGTPEHFADPPPVVREDIRRIVSPRLAAGANDEPTPVVTFYYFVGPLRRSAANVMARSVVSISLIDGFQVADTLNGEPPFYVFLDERLDLVSRSNADASSAAVARIAERILGEPTAGSFVDTVGGRQTLVSYKRSESIGWTLVRVDAYQPLRAELTAARNRILVGTLLAFALTGAAILFLSRRIYSPIDVLMRRIRDAKLVHEESGRRGEVAIILESLTEMSRQISLLERERTEDLEALRTNFLVRVCREPVAAHEHRRARKRFQLALADEDLVAVVVGVRSSDAYDRTRRQFTMAGVSRIVADALEGIASVEVFVFDDSLVCALISEAHALADHELEARLESALRSGRQILDATLTIGVGRAAESSLTVRESFADAVGIVDHRLSVAGAWIHTRESLDRILRGRLDYPGDTERSLVTALRTGAGDAYGAELQAAMRTLENRPFADVTITLSRMTMVLADQANELVGQVGHDSIVAARALNLRLSQLDSLDQWRAWMMTIFHDSQHIVREATRGKRESELRSLVEETIRYVEEHFADAGLYGESVAAHFGYSPSYFAKVFRDATGRSVADHLREYRIARAKEMLANDPGVTVKGVAQAVGYANVNYFYQVFKKIVGVTPAVYKDLPTRDR